MRASVRRRLSALFSWKGFGGSVLAVAPWADDVWRGLQAGGAIAFAYQATQWIGANIPDFVWSLLGIAVLCYLVLKNEPETTPESETSTDPAVPAHAARSTGEVAREVKRWYYAIGRETWSCADDLMAKLSHRVEPGPTKHLVNKVISEHIRRRSHAARNEIERITSLTPDDEAVEVVAEFLRGYNATASFASLVSDCVDTWEQSTQAAYDKWVDNKSTFMTELSSLLSADEFDLKRNKLMKLASSHGSIVIRRHI